MAISIINSGKLSRGYDNFYLGITFLGHRVDSGYYVLCGV